MSERKVKSRPKNKQLPKHTISLLTKKAHIAASQHNGKKRHFRRAGQWPYLVKHIHIHHTHTEPMCWIRSLVCCVSSHFDSTPTRWLDDVWRLGNWLLVHLLDVFWTLSLLIIFLYLRTFLFRGGGTEPPVALCLWVYVVFSVLVIVYISSHTSVIIKFLFFFSFILIIRFIPF